MKLLNSKFNIDDILQLNRNTKNWYKENFPTNTSSFVVIELMYDEKFILHDMSRFYRSGSMHLYLQKASSILRGDTDCSIFILDKYGRCADEKLCWINFKEPLFYKVKK